MPERAALGPDFRRVVSAVHEVVEIGDTARRYGGQGDGGLAVVDGRRSQQAGDRDIAIGGIDVRFVADPAAGMAFCIAFCANRTSRWQIGQHLDKAAASCQLGAEPPRLLLRGRGALFRAPAFALRCLGAGSAFSGALLHDVLFGHLTGFSRASMAVASREMCPTSVFCRAWIRPSWWKATAT